MTDTATNIQPSNLELGDIENLLRVVDYAADNGAFKGWDTIRQVMELRDRVEVFVQYARAASAPKTTDGEPVNE